MRAAVIALMLTFASQAGAACGNLCLYNWWQNATTADVQAELSGGADVMARTKIGTTPLHWAAAFGTSANIQALLAAGADVMARTKYGTTPLHYASTPEVIQALLDAGADVMARTDTGWTPLHSAALAGTVIFNAKPANIQALLDAGADGKAKTKDGKTPWDFAQENEKLKDTKGYWALNDAQYN